MKHLILSIMMISLSACARPTDTTYFKTANDPEFAYILSEYESAKGSRVQEKISIVFGTPSIDVPDAVGVCVKHQNYSMVIIDKKFWKNISFEQQRALL